MRARESDRSGYVNSDGNKIYYEVHGNGKPTILLMPTWTIIHSRFWKGQVPYLARHFRVVTFDGLGNGLSDRPSDPEAYRVEAVSEAVVEVLNATETETAVLASLSKGALWALHFMVHFPERVQGGVYFGPSLPLLPSSGRGKLIGENFNKRLDKPEGWLKYNRYHWLEHYEDFLWFFFGQCFTEPHSSKQIEDCVGWGLETTPEVLVADASSPWPDRETIRDWCTQIRCPVLVIHGDEDAPSRFATGKEFARLTDGELLELKGSGHVPMARDAVRVNLAIRKFIESLASARDASWSREETVNASA